MKTLAFARKLTLKVFWYLLDLVLDCFEERVTTMNGGRYSEVVTAMLKPAIRGKHRGLLSKSIVWLHNDARPHTTDYTAETLRKLNFNALIHPPYCLDLVPSDLFGPRYIT